MSLLRTHGALKGTAEEVESLFSAALHGDLQKMNLLLAAGVDVMTVNYDKVRLFRMPDNYRQPAWLVTVVKHRLASMQDISFNLIGC